MGPCISIGGQQLLLIEFALTPRAFRASSNGCTGLFLKEASPSKTTLKLPNAATEVKRLIDVPELSMSSFSFGSFGFPLNPLTIILLFFCSIPAPKALHPFIAALVSSENNGLMIFDAPSANEAMTIARIVCDFEAGISIFPDNFSVLFTTNFILIDLL